MTDIVKEVQNVANKVYKNGLTYAQNIQNGVFIPAKALKNHKEVIDKLDAFSKKIDNSIEKNDEMIKLILSKISK
jgi:hypothetical protein